MGILHTIHERIERIMADISQLEAAVDRLTDAVNAAVTQIEGGGNQQPDDQQPAVDALTSKVNDAVNALQGAGAPPSPSGEPPTPAPAASPTVAPTARWEPA